MHGNRDVKAICIIRTSRKTRKRFMGATHTRHVQRHFHFPNQGLRLLQKIPASTADFRLVRIITKGRKPWDLCINGECSGKNEKYKNPSDKKQQ